MGENSIINISRKVFTEDDGFFLEGLSQEDLFVMIHQMIKAIGFNESHKKSISLEDIITAYIATQDFSMDDSSGISLIDSVYQYLLYINFPNSIDFDRYQKYSRNLGQIIIIYTIFQRYYELSSIGTSNFKLVFPEDITIKSMEFSAEFETFKYHFLRERTYELMKLNQELFGHTSYDHIMGVNQLSYIIAMQLNKIGVKIDVGIVCGAALCHDIGKYACDKAVDNVARIHYYFTDKWFEYRKLEYMRNIAVNHSTWDLELENLSIESLVLILSDFMVKKDRTSGKIRYFSLDDSFKIVMDKLENLTEEKEERYKRVFAKLKDFEFFLMSCGVEVFMDGRQIIEPSSSIINVNQSLKNTAIKHSIEVMHKLRSLESINKMMKQAMDMKDSEGILARLRVIEEYFVYLTPYQKKSVLELVFDFLYNPHERIREVSASITGKLIYHYHSGFRKWIPEREKYKYKKEQYERTNLLNSLFLKAQGLYGILSKSKYELLCRSVGTVIGSVGKFCSDENLDMNIEDSNLKAFIERLIEGVQEDKRSALIRIEVLSHTVTNKIFFDKSVLRLISMIKSQKQYEVDDINSRAWYLLKEGIINRQNCSILKDEFKSLKDVLDEEDLLSNYLHIIIINSVFQDGYELKNGMISDLKGRTRSIFLSNLKSTTTKTEKLVNIEILEELSYFLEDFDLIYLALHLINLLKTNEDENVRNKAGSTLCVLVERLDIEMLNDIVVELFKSFESEDYEFVSKIAYYLGYITTFLPNDEYLELFKTQKQSMKIGSTNKKLLILDTTLSLLLSSSERGNIADLEVISNSMKIIFIGLTDDKDVVRHHSFKVLNHGVFHNTNLSEVIKAEIFRIYGKKLSTMILDLYKFEDNKEVKLSGDFNMLYRFISNCAYYKLNLDFCEANKIAIYSGAFDPISKGQKNVIRKLIQLGYEVNLQINEFIWNRSVQPYEHRKRMVELTIAEYNNVFLISPSETYNLGVESEVNRLINYYKSKDLYVLIGEDDLVNNTVYTFGDNGIDRLNHIVVVRGNTKQSDRMLIDERLKQLKGYELIDMTADESTMISPMSIRSSVDKNYDLNDFMDERVARYIRDHDLYIREPNLKGDAANRSLKFTHIEDDNKKTLLITGRVDRSSIGRIEYMISKNIESKTMSVTGYKMYSMYKVGGLHMIMLSELILTAASNSIDELVILKCCNVDLATEKQLKVMGFKEKSVGFVLKINKLAVVILDFHANLKVGPLTTNKFVERGIIEFRERLLIGLSNMLSERTVLFVSKEQIEGHLLDLVENKDQSGNMALCIADLFKKGIIPNFVTKSLNVSEVYNLERSLETLEAEEWNLSIEDQIEIIKKFYMNLFILTDFLGTYGISQGLIKKMVEAELKINLVITFMSSAYVEELLKNQNLSMCSAYHVLDDTIVIRESSLMPFAGGIPIVDKVYGSCQQNMINIFPYCERQPFDIEEVKFLSFSVQMLKWISELYEIIEKEHEKNSGKRLLISELGKVFNHIRFPYVNTYVSFKEDFSIIDFLEEEMRKVQKYTAH